ncbi:MAG: hypothetical protein LBB75_02235 [Oscillospiraceae bacterium]|jgi:hypothetical protein|nr:hypothetical protein [Oscillospiraceae bacterium]
MENRIAALREYIDGDADVMQHCLYDITMPVAERERDRHQKLLDEFGLKE